MRKMLTVVIAVLVFYDYSTLTQLDFRISPFGPAVVETSTAAKAEATTEAIAATETVRSGSSESSLLFAEQLAANVKQDTKSAVTTEPAPLPVQDVITASAQPEEVIVVEEPLVIETTPTEGVALTMAEVTPAEAKKDEPVVASETEAPKSFRSIEKIDFVADVKLTDGASLGKMVKAPALEILPAQAPLKERLAELAETTPAQVAAVAETAIATPVNTFDLDNDGILDADDKCPQVAGVDRFEGCPVPDSDADGVNDEDDRCPLEKGALEQSGCPVLETAAAQPLTLQDVVISKASLTSRDNTVVRSHSLQFDLANKMLDLDDFNIVLQYADKLRLDASLKVEVAGILEAGATTEADNKLSISRAENVRQYLVDLGVNKGQILLKSVINPAVVDNSGDRNKSLSRRVEIKLLN